MARNRAFSSPVNLTQEIKSDSGQSLIEFLVSFIFSVAFLFLFITLGLNFTSGDLVHYATFASARTYLTGGKDNNQPNDTDAQNEAKSLFNTFKLGDLGVAASLEIIPPPSSPGEKFEYVGTRTKFEREISMIGMLGGQKLNLVSESFLGREPTRADCFKQVCNAMGNGICEENTSTVHITTEDNGC